MKIDFLDLAAPYRELREEMDAAWRRVNERGWYLLGEELTAFESEYAAACGTKHALGVANGLDALELTLRAFGIGPGDEVVVPAQTFIATWIGVSATGAKPVPADVDEGTANLDARAFEAAITPRTRAVIPVHLAGCPADMDAIGKVAAKRGLRMLEDAAQAHGARWRGRPCGALGDAATFSFYPAKNLGALGDGGCVVTSDDAVADKVRVLRNYGSRTKYAHEVLGRNSRLDELHAAVLRVKLRHLAAWNERRRVIADSYLAALRGAPGLSLPVVPDGAQPSWHLFMVRHPRRDALRAHLEKDGIGTIVHYPAPVHLTQAYADHGFARGAFPVAERLADTTLSLPIGPHLAASDAARVAASVLSFCGQG